MGHFNVVYLLSTKLKVGVGIQDVVMFTLPSLAVLILFNIPGRSLISMLFESRLIPKVVDFLCVVYLISALGGQV